MLFYTAATERMRITSAGNVLVGTTTATGSLNTEITINNSSAGNYAGIGFKTADTNRGYIGATSTNIEIGAIGFTSFYTGGGSERMRITSGGDLYVGSSSITTANVSLYFEKGSGTVTQVFSYSSGTKTIQEYYRQSGGSIGSITYNGTLTLYNATSDYRLKEDLKDFSGLEIVSKLKTYNFNWKDAGVRDYGMMAHELQEVLPNYVSGDKDAKQMQQVDYSKIVPILVKAIQEQQAQIEELIEKIK